MHFLIGSVPDFADVAWLNRRACRKALLRVSPGIGFRARSCGVAPRRFDVVDRRAHRHGKNEQEEQE